MNLWNWIIPIFIIAVIVWVTAKAVIGTYFGAKEGFVDKLVAKLRREP
jgi:hypothetical protein